MIVNANPNKSNPTIPDITKCILYRLSSTNFIMPMINNMIVNGMNAAPNKLNAITWWPSDSLLEERYNMELTIMARKPNPCIRIGRYALSVNIAFT